MQRFAAEELRRFAQGILEGVGTPAACARLVGDSLVDANLTGHDSHGVIRLLGYVDAARLGQVQPAAEPLVSAREAATARIDGCWGWGQPAMALATATAIALAAEFGLGAAVVNRCCHVGRVAPYVETIARAGMVGLALANAGAAVAPYGGRGRVLGTNPVAWAVPRAGQEPISFDIATSAVAEGKLRVARAKGERVRPGLLLDAAGQPSESPDDFYAGGALLPFGGHKGYGFGVLAQLLGRGLAGLDPAAWTEHRGANGPLVLALNVAPFVAPARFAVEIEAQCTEIKTVPPAADSAEVLLPGEPEQRTRQQRLADGIPLPERTWTELHALAAELGVAPAAATVNVTPATARPPAPRS